jgi:hypothetical protein
MAAELPNSQTGESEDKRRNGVPDLDARGVTFIQRSLSPERLQALREFLRTASADDIATIRENFGDMPEVLISIGLEVG